ncbi:MAG: TetR/AcrR family transcriptional regulator [Nocardiopsaceae bacterium]|jgi:AcrR family transcriptional regulator|nr:TetR/AcrR family transcriptional regulator [Nocardiopsaceae bacterium]
MPRVSEQYLEQRKLQILDAAQRCFSRNGFYEASMQDVFREAGLSAGAVYRYFKSKDELVQAIAGRSLGQVTAVIEAALAEDPVPGLDEITGRVAAKAQELSREGGPIRIAPSAWAAAMYDPAVGATVRDAIGRLRAWWVRAAERLQEGGRLAPDADVNAIGATMFGLLPGFILQALILGDVEATDLQRGLRDLLQPLLLSPMRG